MKTAQIHIKQLRAFFAWLHRDDDYSWRKPEGFEDIKIRVPLTSHEKAARLSSTQVPTFALDELCMLYKYATPLERLLLLLGMNCGFGAAESGTILLSQVHLFQSHPYRKRWGLKARTTIHSSNEFASRPAYMGNICCGATQSSASNGRFNEIKESARPRGMQG